MGLRFVVGCLRALGLEDFWAAVAVALFVIAVYIWADYVTSIGEIAGVQ